VQSVAVVVYPTAERLPDIRKLAEKGERPLVIINPQWRESGQVIRCGPKDVSKVKTCVLGGWKEFKRVRTRECKGGCREICVQG
jgi:hypothetical protein